MMPLIWLTSDCHFGHDKDFIWETREFNSVEEMNEAIVERWNSKVQEDDDVYMLGDFMMGEQSNIKYIQRLRGRIHLIRGNHDTDARMKLYAQQPNIVEICDAKYLKYKKYNFFLSHFPCVTDNGPKEHLRENTLNLFGHTHQFENFYDMMPGFENFNPLMYHVGVDSHNCYPVLLDDIIEGMREELNKYIKWKKAENPTYPFI